MDAWHSLIGLFKFQRVFPLTMLFSYIRFCFHYIFKQAKQLSWQACRGKVQRVWVRFPGPNLYSCYFSTGNPAFCQSRGPPCTIMIWPSNSSALQIQFLSFGGPPYASSQQPHWIRQSQMGLDLLGSESQTAHPPIARSHQAHLVFFLFLFFISFFLFF